MKFDSALEVQARIFREVFDYTEIPAAAGMAGGPGLFVAATALDMQVARADLGLAVRRPSRKKVEDIALGVSEGMAPDDSRLAVLVQDERTLKSRLVGKIVDLARNEADVFFIGRQRAAWTQVRNNPLRLGCSTSPAAVPYSGTMGCFCADALTGSVGLLSNNHVLANINRAPIGTHIIQPGAGDRGRVGRDDVAVLARFVQIQFGGVPNAVDAAFAASLQHGRNEDRKTLYNSANVPAPAIQLKPNSIAQAIPGMAVFKTGRTTRHTRGRVRAVNVNNYHVNLAPVGVARFDNQILIEMANSPVSPFSLPGDSGSLIVDGAGQPVGLLFAGSSTGGAGNVGITGCNPISSVLSQLGVVLI
jgi:hypothetical protein